MKSRRSLHDILLRWLPGWLFISVHAVAAGQHMDERIAAWRLRRAKRRYDRIVGRPRDGPD